MERISMDTIGPLPSDMGLNNIIVIIDTFTRYVESFLKQDGGTDTLLLYENAFWVDRTLLTQIDQEVSETTVDTGFHR